MTDFELKQYIQLFIKYEEDKIKSRRKFERDLFMILTILVIVCIAILISCSAIRSYLEYIMKSVIALEYK